VISETGMVLARALLVRGLNRRQVARALRCRTPDVYEAFPITDMDRLRIGKAVQIGRILVKRCNRCHVTKELSKFYARGTASGCGMCLDCGK
jgi:hypothetical protein